MAWQLGECVTFNFHKQMGKCECSVNPADEDAPNAAGAWEAGYCDYLFMG